MQNCEKIFQGYFSQVPIDDRIRHLYCSQGAVRMLVKSFISNPDSADLHAKDCEQIISILKKREKEGSKKNYFEANLLYECKEHFESILTAMEPISTTELLKNGRFKKSDKFHKYSGKNTNVLGTIKLIGELFQCNIIRLEALNNYFKLLTDPEYLCEETLYCIYILMTIVGKKMESMVGIIEMIKYIRPLDTFFQNNRNIFSDQMLHIMFDILILSRNNWDPKILNPASIKSLSTTQKTDTENKILLKEDQETRNILKQIDTDLNNLNDDNFKTILNNIKTHNLNDDAINKCAELVFEKAAKNPDLSQVHAKLSHDLALIYGFKLENACESTFNKHLLNLCSIQCHTSENELAVGTFAFIGELFNVDLISKRDIYEYKNKIVSSFAKTVSETTIECLCVLLMKVGQQLVKEDGYFSIKKDLKTLKSIKRNKQTKVQKHVKLLIQSLLKKGKIWKEESLLATAMVKKEPEEAIADNPDMNEIDPTKQQKTDMAGLLQQKSVSHFFSIKIY